MSYEIKTASYSDIQMMSAWAQQEGWNPGLNDALAYALIDANGFFIGYLDGKPIACISTLKYDGNFAFLGFYIVDPAYRGQGYGYRIWQHAVNYAGKMNTALDGVVAQQENYKKSGFKLAYRNIRYVLKNHQFNPPSEISLQPIDKINLSEILNYDQQFFPANRAAFITYWLMMPNAKAWVYYEGEKIKGYGVIRQCHNGYKIAPLFADNFAIADILLQKLCTSVPPHTEIFIDIPEVNPAAKQLVEKYQMQAVFETARMYIGKEPDISVNRTYSVTSFEVG